MKINVRPLAHAQVLSLLEHLHSSGFDGRDIAVGAASGLKAFIASSTEDNHEFGAIAEIITAEWDPSMEDNGHP